MTAILKGQHLGKLVATNDTCVVLTDDVERALFSRWKHRKFTFFGATATYWVKE